jgi:hypothetical protein
MKLWMVPQSEVSKHDSKHDHIMPVFKMTLNQGLSSNFSSAFTLYACYGLEF